jgi:DNA-binding protein HU-beta
MNRSDILSAVASKEGIPVRDVEKIVDSFLEVITLSLTLDEDVSIRNFGKFEVRHRSEVTRRNPKTGEPVEVPAKKAVGFKASPWLKNRINVPRIA